jgi:hypothetical protein
VAKRKVPFGVVAVRKLLFLLPLVSLLSACDHDNGAQPIPPNQNLPGMGHHEKDDDHDRSHKPIYSDDKREDK